MTILSLLILLIMAYICYRIISARYTAHAEKKYAWQHIRSDEDGDWFYNPQTMIRAYTKINSTGIIEVKKYDIKKTWRR